MLYGHSRTCVRGFLFQSGRYQFIVWGLLYAFLPLLWGGHGWDGAKTHLLTFLYNFPSNAIHLWFVYMLIGVYFFMPILSPWLKQVGRKEELFFLGLWFLTTFWHYVKLCVPGGEIYGECRLYRFSVDGTLRPYLH